MSRKQIKKILETQKKLKEEEEEDEDEEEVVPVVKPKAKGKANAFELLNLEDDENDNDNDNDESDETESTPAKPAAKKKKNKKKKSKAKQEEKKPSKEEEDIDEILNSLDGGKERGKLEGNKEKGTGNVVEEERLLKLDARHLDPDQEIRRVFGAQVLGNQPRPNQARGQQIRGTKKNVQKKTILVRAKEDWPPMYPGVDMELLPPRPGTPSNVQYFKIVWTIGYQELQQHFYDCVETADPYSFQDLLMIHPYHVDATLQLAQVCIQTGDYAMAGDLVERCLYTFECAWHPRFAPQGAVNCYLEFSVPENRSFFLAILKHIQLLGRRGSTRTALEFAKLLISLDPADPLYMRGVLDYYCLRGKEFAFLLSLFERAQVDNTPFSIYPNFCYSAALAKLTLELQKSSKSSSSSSTEATPDASKRVGSNPYPLASSKYLLFNALTLFPMVLLPLLNKAGISYRDVLRGDSPSFFHAEIPVSPLLQKTVNLFVEKNNTLWKAPEVVQWLKEVMGEVQRQIDANGTEAKNILEGRDKVVQEWNEMNTRMGNVPLLLSEHAETASPLPPELFVHNQGQQPPPIPAPNPVPLAANPLALFIQTLMPWVNIPPPPIKQIRSIIFQ